MSSSSLPKAVESSGSSVFFETPEILTIDEDAKTAYSTSGKVDTLIRELSEKGPHVAFGWMGPKYYTSEPFALTEKFGGEQIFGWKPGTRSEKAEKTHAIVVGARKVEEKAFVYFRLSLDCTRDTKTYIREHRPTSDSRVYVSSNETFHKYLFDLYPPVAEEKTHPNFVSSGSTSCTAKELEYVIKLVSITPLDSILKDQEAACKALGQEIFNAFKEASGGDSSDARDAVVSICNAIRYCAKDGQLRKQYIEFAWDGIGDANWRWRR